LAPLRKDDLNSLSDPVLDKFLSWPGHVVSLQALVWPSEAASDHRIKFLYELSTFWTKWLGRLHDLGDEKDVKSLHADTTALLSHASRAMTSCALSFVTTPYAKVDSAVNLLSDPSHITSTRKADDEDAPSGLSR